MDFADKEKNNVQKSTACSSITAYLFTLYYDVAVSVYLEIGHIASCLLYTSDAADERSSVDLGGRRIIKKKNNI